MVVATSADPVTRDWVRNVSDERAVANGCSFDELRASYTIYWIERYCRLYEGDGYAGQPLILRGCQQCGTYDLPPATEVGPWDEQDAGNLAVQVYLERARRYRQCVKDGHGLDWQYECLMRLFGWVFFNPDWNRKVRRFRWATIFVPKKSKKSPTLSALGLYLLVGDGEPGQKVFFGAKDGMQARKIAGEHAVAMLQQSPELSAACTLNRSTFRITHNESRSWIEPLSSSNARTQESKEGLNGCVLIDETHVVDWDFVRRISRAGISRSEPLQIEVSTAGNNPSGYGKARFDLATDVLKGEKTNQELFAAIYAAPQDLTDEELEKDPLKWGRMANPAMGHTVKEREFLADYNNSKLSVQDLLDFKMYRLNIWQRSSNPWLREADWLRCKSDFVEGDLLGKDCWAGLDLARSRDMSALVLVFKGDGQEEFYLLPYFWLPRKRAKELESLCAVKEWERAGFLEVTEGPVTDYSFIKRRFRELAGKFNIRELAYDPKFAEEVTQSLSEGTSDGDGKVVEEGTGVERFVFTQNDASFAAPTLDFERLVAAGTLRHNGHPVLSWQAGHAHVKVRENMVKRVVKPKEITHMTVDGIHSAIMALARAMMSSDGGEWYRAGMLGD